MNSSFSAKSNRNASARSVAAGCPSRSAERGVHKAVEQLVDVLFSNLRQLFPASVSTALKNPCDEAAAKRQWIAAFVENGITSKQQLSAGMKCARASGSPFWPSPGEFIQWCKRDDYSAVGLPDEDELYDMVMKYCARRGLYETPEKYPWKTNAHYWMVTGLYSTMRAQGLTEQELRVKCRGELGKMAARIRSGEQIPAPLVQLEKLYVPASNEKALNHVAHLKALIKSKRSSSLPK